MSNKKRFVKPSILFDYANSVFDEGKSIKISVAGNSMYPFLRDKIDDVEIRRVSYNDVKVADIVLIKKDESYILHRVFKKNEKEFYIVGDAQVVLEGPYTKDQLVGKVLSIYRKNKKISCKSIPYKFLVRLWMLIRPLRLVIINSYLRFRNKTALKSR